MNAHDLGRALLAGPDLPVWIEDDEYGDSEVFGALAKSVGENATSGKRSVEFVTFATNELDLMTPDERAARLERIRAESLERKMRMAVAEDAAQEVDF